MSASTIEGTDASEWVNGGVDDSIIDAKAGNDEIYAPLGNNTINGGEGRDVLVIYGKDRADFSVEAVGDGSFLVRGENFNGEITENRIESVEAIIFDDGIFDLDTVPSNSDANPGDSPLENVAFAEPAEEEILTQEEPFIEQQLQASEPEPEPEPARAVAEVQIAEPESESARFVPARFNGFGPDVGTETQEASTETEADFVNRVVELTNEVRRSHGLPDLTVNFQLQEVAQQHSQNMAYQDFFSHTGQDGSQPWDRGLAAGYDYRNYGENIAAGQRTPEEVVQAWVDSPGHFANIINPAFTEIGVGFKYLADDPGDLRFQTYWSQEFGRQRNS